MNGNNPGWSGENKIKKKRHSLAVHSNNLLYKDKSSQVSAAFFQPQRPQQKNDVTAHHASRLTVTAKAPTVTLVRFSTQTSSEMDADLPAAVQPGLYPQWDRRGVTDLKLKTLLPWTTCTDPTGKHTHELCVHLCKIKKDISMFNSL